MTNDVEHLSMCLLAIGISSLEKHLFKSFVHFLARLFVFLLLSLGVFYIFWILAIYQIHDLQIFSPILWVGFSLSGWCPLMHKSFKF